MNLSEHLVSLGIYEGKMLTSNIKDFAVLNGWMAEWGEFRYPTDGYSAFWYQQKMLTDGKDSLNSDELSVLEWHRDDEQQYRDYWMLVMCTHVPTQIKLPDQTIYFPKPNELVAFNNETCYHRLPINMNRAEAENRIFYRSVAERIKNDY